ncbi:hypothetical protein [Streptomyces sp. NPDC088736]|uniref:hypothetical protein n=1 Tax=Streptomyces sp. NPDC088736 TaxID=3365881 RepID=UPI0038168E71
MDIANLLLGGIVGAFLGYVLPKSYESTRARVQDRTRRRRREVMASARVYTWVIEYYRRRNRSAELYVVDTGTQQVTIPFLTRPEWQKAFRVGSGFPQLIRSSGVVGQNFPVDRRGLAKRERMGQRLFNAPALFFESLETNDDRVFLNAGRCDYFHVATSLLSIEEETFRAVRSRFRTPTPVRDKWLGNPRDTQGTLRKPFSIAASVAIVFRGDGTPCVMLQTRSHETVTYGGLRAVIPYFGVVPVERPRGYHNPGIENSIDLLETNLAKEYCEELFSYDRLIEESKLRGVDARWFWEFPEAKELRSLLDSERATLWCLGFGFDGLNGSATLALMLQIDDQYVTDSLMRRIAGNWEVADRTTDGGAIELMEIPSLQLESLFTDHQLTYGSAFTLGRILEHFRSLDSG